MSSFGEEYVELVIYFSEKDKYQFDSSIDVIDFCEKEYIRSLEDFDSYAIQKFIHTYFDIELDDTERKLFKYSITRNIWAEFDIEIHCLYDSVYCIQEYKPLIRKLKIKKVIDE